MATATAIKDKQLWPAVVELLKSIDQLPGNANLNIGMRHE